MAISSIINNLQSHGRYSFVKDEISQLGKLSSAAVNQALWRLAKNKRVRHIRSGFYAIIPVEYSNQGVLPATWFVDPLMNHLKVESYYVALLSAASIHGSSHQQPQEFQVMIPKAERRIKLDDLVIRFFRKKSCISNFVTTVKTPTGYLRVSSPELTALDLILYSKQVGGMSRVAQVLLELGERLDSKRLAEVCKKDVGLAHIQRLGWLLEHVGFEKITKDLRKLVKQNIVKTISLDPARQAIAPTQEDNNYWHVNSNCDLEIE